MSFGMLQDGLFFVFQILCLTGRLLLHLSLLGAFAFLFVDSIHMYVLVHAYSSRVLSDRYLKFLGIGWGQCGFIFDHSGDRVAFRAHRYDKSLVFRAALGDHGY